MGHILLEGVPGLAKTLAINTLSQAVHGSFSRIQFTPDLLPADVVGTLIYNMKENDFKIKKGPIFANFLVNRRNVNCTRFFHSFFNLKHPKTVGFFKSAKLLKFLLSCC